MILNTAGRCAMWAQFSAGVAEFPPRPLSSFSLPLDLERYRTVALGADADQPRPRERHADRAGRFAAYRALRYEAAQYDALRDVVEQDVEATQLAFVRDIFIPLISPDDFRPEWRSETAVALADAAFADRAFDRLPVLADSLEEAGCDDPHVLAHCREETEHVRGCWLLELVRTRPTAG